MPKDTVTGEQVAAEMVKDLEDYIATQHIDLLVKDMVTGALLPCCFTHNKY